MKTLSAKLWTAFGGLLLVMVISSISLDLSFDSEQAAMQRSAAASVQLENQVDRLNTLTSDLQRLALETALQGTDEKLLQTGARASEYFEVSDAVALQLATEPEGTLRTQRLAQLRQVDQSFREMMTETLSALAGQLEQSEQIDMALLTARSESFRRELNTFHQLERQARALEQAHGRDQFRRVLEINRWALLLTLIAMAVVFAFVRRNIVLRTSKLAAFVNSAAQQPLTVGTRAIVEGHDEITLLAQHVNRLFDHLQDNAVSKDFFNRIIENIGNALFVTDRSGTIRLVNAKAIELTGTERDCLLGQPLARYLSCAEFLDQAIVPGSECHLSGTERIAVACLRSELADSYVYVAIDMRERNAAQEQLRLAAKVIDNTMQGVMITDTSGTIVSVNPAFTELTGYAPSEALGNTPRLLKSGHHGPEFYTSMWQSMKLDGSWQGELWNRRKSGEIFPEWLSLSSVHNSQGEITHFVALFSDITERKRQEQHNEFLALHDALTNLPNRRLLNERLEQNVNRCRRRHESFALMFLDLDHFKPINDTLGHAVGDQLLKAVAQRLQTWAPRDSDTVARIGGDEFVILLSHIEREEGAAVVANKLVRAFNEPFAIAMHQINLTVSIGIAVFPQHGGDATRLTKSADTAMYHCKEFGRNGYRFFSAEMEEIINA